MTEECKKEIEEYVRSEGWDSIHVFNNKNVLLSSYFSMSNKGEERNLLKKWNEDEYSMNIYLLEYIGHILRKHNINTITVNYASDTTYESTTWKKGEIFVTLDI